ncbi:MAG: DNA-binding protein [Desulfosalsimonadaceae bacterium]
MPGMEKIGKKSAYMGRLAHGADLLEELTNISREQGLLAGRIEAIGAVQKAVIGYYNQKSREYQYNILDQAMEIVKLCGNVSVKDGEPMVHAHIALADEQGRTFGGHLAPGTVIFACECIVEAFEGPAFERVYDEQTGLALWDL